MSEAPDAGAWLSGRAARTPERIAIEFEDRRVSFGALAAGARRRARGLAEHGVAPGDRVAVLVPNGLAWVETLHAVLSLGASILPLNLRLTASELALPLADARPTLLVHDDGPLAERAAEATQRIAAGPGAGGGVPLAAVRALAGTERGAGSNADPNAGSAASDAQRDGLRRASGAPDPAAILYTSGTTGAPKGCCLGAAAFEASARAAARHLAPPGDARAAGVARWLVCLPCFHVGGLQILVRGVLFGNSVVVHERFDPERVSHAFDHGSIHAVSLVPTMLEAILDARRDAPTPATLRLVLLGGAPASPELIARARAAGVPLAPTYGLTETCSQVATAPPGDLEPGLPPLPGVTLRIDGATRPGDAGEILVRSETLMKGYWERPDATAEALRHGWLHTGDEGRIDERGRLHVLDRRSDLIVSGGENVYPAEIEAVLRQHAAVADAAVVSIPDARFGARPLAWLAVRAPVADPSALCTELESFCRQRLAGYKIPAGFRFREQLPRSASGKLLRAALRREAAALVG